MVSFKNDRTAGGTFQMGSDPKEPFHQADEGAPAPSNVGSLLHGGGRGTWDQYWAFYGKR